MLFGVIFLVAVIAIIIIASRRSGKGKNKNIDDQIENKFNAFKAYAERHNLHWGFVRDKDTSLYINNTIFNIDMADDHWEPLDL